MKETRNLELKEIVNNSFLKTVSAFANYNGGEIIFGINDEGIVIGIENLIESSLSIEHKINDSIKPNVSFNINVNKETKVITLNVFPGENRPYLYKSKAYKRNDTSTIEVDQLEFKRLILSGSNTSYESLSSNKKNLNFNYLEKELQKKIKIQSLTTDILISLNLLDKEKGYNIAAELLSDENSYLGIDIARFGEDINIILNRKTFENESILSQFNKVMNIFEENYQYEKIIGSRREQISLIPKEAFREVIANSLVHREWDINSHIRILMFEDYIEVVSPGGLPEGMSVEEYLSGQISILRNPIIGNIFYRLNLIEQFGTGIKRIKKSYEESLVKPKFEVYENSIKIILPIIEKQIDGNLSNDEKTVYHIFEKRQKYSSSNVVASTKLGKTKAVEVLNSLVDQGYIKVTGKGPATRYSLHD